MGGGISQPQVISCSELGQRLGMHQDEAYSVHQQMQSQLLTQQQNYVRALAAQQVINQVPFKPADIKKILGTPKEEKKTMFKTFREYLSNHKELFCTLIVVFIADHIVFKGAFRKKLHDIVDQLLNKATKNLEA
jgi:hypothetical protein